VCWYTPAGDFECEQTLDLEGMPKDSGFVYRALLPTSRGVGLDWRAVVNQSGAYTVGATRHGPDGTTECLLGRARPKGK